MLGCCVPVPAFVLLRKWEAAGTASPDHSRLERYLRIVAPARPIPHGPQLHTESHLARRLCNTTHFVQLVIPRVPNAEVFELTNFTNVKL